MRSVKIELVELPDAGVVEVYMDYGIIVERLKML